MIAKRTNKPGGPFKIKWNRLSQETRLLKKGQRRVLYL